MSVTCSQMPSKSLRVLNPRQQFNSNRFRNFEILPKYTADKIQDQVFEIRNPYSYLGPRFKNCQLPTIITKKFKKYVTLLFYVLEQQINLINLWMKTKLVLLKDNKRH